MSIANEINRIAGAKADIKRAINAKGGTLVNEKLTAYADAIDNLLPEEFGNRVRFIDYDGTVLKTMYVADGESATPPENPAHPGMIFQGWNTSLTDILSHRDIGAVYTTASGGCEFDVRMVVRTGYTVTFCPYIESGILTIDWGDGGTGTVAGTGKQSVSYTYADYGEYTIKFTISADGSWYIPDYFCGGSEGNSCLVNMRLTGIRQISGYAFHRCRCLRGFTMSRDIATIGEYAFCEDYALLTAVFPDSVTGMGRNTLHYCYGMRRCVFPDTLTSIPEWICHCCHALDGITVPDGVTDIGSGAFYNCYGLQQASLPSSMKILYSEVFRECWSLEKINFPDGMTDIRDSCFYNCHGLKKAHLPDTVTLLGSYVFAYCHALREINVPAGIIAVPNGMCYRCYSLESILIPENITVIGDEAFCECYSLRNVRLHGGITNIRYGAFNYCRAMQNYYLYPAAVPTLNSTSAFYDIPGSCVIWVPASPDREILTAYKTATNWSNYADSMREMEE